MTDIRDTKTELVEHNNPYGQVLFSEITVHGPVSAVQPIKDKDLRYDFGPKTAQNILPPPRLQPSDNNNLFALYISNPVFWEGLQRNIAYGMLLTPVSAGIYRRVGLIEHAGYAGNDGCQFHKLDKATIKIV